MRSRTKPFIGIAGTIGAGKSTLARELGQALGLEVEPEPISPYLGDFYQDPEAWAFQMQAYMIGARALQAQRLGEKGGIQDRTIFEDQIFAEMLTDQGIMSSRDLATYHQLRLALSGVPAPDVLLWLRVSPEISIERTARRARAEEEGIPDQYLRDLCAAYERWAGASTQRIICLEWDDPEPVENVIELLREAEVLG